MARTFTVLQLVDRGRQGADKQNDEHIPLEEWKSYLSSAYAELYAILVDSGWRYFEAEDKLVADGSAKYTLPHNFLATVGVDYKVNASGERRFLDSLQAQERNMYNGVSGVESRHYALVGNSITLYPTPKIGQEYIHVYVPQPPQLDDAADDYEVDVVTPDGENFILWNMAFKALHKEGSDTRDAVAEREAARVRVAEWAAMRSINEPHRRIVRQELANPYYDPGDYRGRGGGSW